MDIDVVSDTAANVLIVKQPLCCREGGDLAVPVLYLQIVARKESSASKDSAALNGVIV